MVKKLGKDGIKLLVFDVDGTLTDGKIRYVEDGTEIKVFDIKDGLGIAVWNKLGGESAIITGRVSDVVRKRGLELGIKHIYMGVNDKGEVITELLANLKLSKNQVACIGDDVNDLPLFVHAGLCYAPANAANAVKNRADILLEKKGGEGAVREMIEDVFRRNGHEGAVEQHFMRGFKGENRG